MKETRRAQWLICLIMTMAHGWVGSTALAQSTASQITSTTTKNAPKDQPQDASDKPSTAPKELSLVQETLKEDGKVRSKDESASEPSLNESLPITYKEKEIFSIYFSTQDKKNSAQRAKRINQLVEQAIELQNNQPRSIVKILDSHQLQLFIHGQFVGEFRSQEIEPLTRSVEQVRANLAGQVEAFVTDEVEKRIWQARARKFFLSFFILITALVVFSQIRQLFDRLEQRFQDRKNSILPIAFMSETVVTSDTLSSFLTLALVVGRFVIYSLIFFGALFGIFSQFDALREIGPQTLNSIYRRVGWGARSTIQKLPGVFLAFLLIVCLQITLRFLNLLSKNFASGRLKLKGLEAHRLPVARSVGVVLAILILIPLILGSLFGDFNSPAQITVHILTLAISLGTVPLFMEFAAGAYLIWTGELREGQWIEVKGKTFELVQLGLTHVTVVPTGAGRAKYPYHQFIWYPFEILAHSPLQKWVALVELASFSNNEEFVTYLKEQQFLSTEPNDSSMNVSLISLDDGKFKLALTTQNSLQTPDVYKQLSQNLKAFDARILELYEPSTRAPQ